MGRHIAHVEVVKVPLADMPFNPKREECVEFHVRNVAGAVVSLIFDASVSGMVSPPVTALHLKITMCVVHPVSPPVQDMMEKT